MSTSNFPKQVLVSVVLSLPIPYVLILLQQKFAVPDETTPSMAFYVSACLILVAYAILVQLLGATSGTASASSVSEGSDDRFDKEQGADDTGPEGLDSGSVKWFNVNKGYGFITTSTGEDVFVHFRSIRGKGRRSLRQGQSVRFDLVDGDKGRQAENVSALD